MLATSAWLAIGPALIAGGIGLTSAVLSFLMARASLDRAAIESDRDRRNQRDLLLLPRRSEAAAQVWKLVYVVESTGTLTDSSRSEFATAVMWLPREAQEEVL